MRRSDRGTRNHSWFYGEVRRVAKPKAILAAWSYGSASVSGDIDPVLRWFDSDYAGQYWPPERRHIDRGYRTLDFPFAEIDMRANSMTQAMTREQFLGYLGTWSAVVRFREERDEDPIAELRARLDDVWGPEEVRDVRWPLYSRVGVVA